MCLFMYVYGCACLYVGKEDGAKLATTSGFKIIANTHACSVPGTVLKVLHIHCVYSFRLHSNPMR